MSSLDGQPLVFGTGYNPVNAGLGSNGIALGIHPQDDGSVLIDISPPRSDKPKSNRFEDNLADDISVGDLAQISEDLLQGIQADEDSRSDWVQNYNRGMDFLGLKIEDRSTQQARKNCSTVTHPLLLWAIVNFQSLARAELLPAAGPAKVSNEGQAQTGREDSANDLERRFNRFLTTTAKEFYPDTDRGLFYLGYGGTLFKKVYDCPLRNRPVSECVYAPDLIVSNDATDLDNASRVTHRITMTQSQVRRMQLDDVWRDIDLSQPTYSPSQVEARQQELTGLKKSSRTEDQPYTIYESYVELDLSKYGIKEKGAPDRLPLPYRVTVDKDSRQVLDVRRNWKSDDKEFRQRKCFVKYSLVPGMGFLDLGFLHLLGNQTRALTGILRIMIDAGVFSNFPGGLKVKGTRQTTNELMPGPGEFVEIDTGPAERIQDAIMALPYKGPTAELIQLYTMIEQEGKTIAGTVDMPVGEGRADTPVGTIMALLEQKTQVIGAVFKRLHGSQQEELALLKERLVESPEVLFDDMDQPEQGELEAITQELADLSLVPASDPNVPAQMHRNLQNAFLIQLVQQVPQKFDIDEVIKRSLRQAHIDPQGLLLPPAPPQPQGDPNQQTVLQLAIAEMQARKQEVQNQTVKIGMQQQNDQHKQTLDLGRLHLDSQKVSLDAQKQASQNSLDHAKLYLETHYKALGEERARIGQLLDDHHKDQEHAARASERVSSSLGGEQRPQGSPRGRGRASKQVS